MSLRYVSNSATIDPVAADVIGTYTFRANDIQDPNGTGVGHQPYGHDTLALVYNRNKVLSSKITVEFLAGATGGTYNAFAAIQLSTEGTPTTNPTLFLEQPATTYKAVGGLDTGHPVKVAKTFQADKFFKGIPNKDLTANFGGSPTEQAFYHIGIGGMNEGTDVPRFDMIVTITYKVLVLEPKSLGES